MVVLAGVLGGAAYVLNKKDDTSTATGGGVGAKVIELPINDIAGVAIQSASGSLSLVKKADVWTVEDRAGYPANFERVHGLLMKVWDLKTVQEVKVGASQFARLELSEPLAGSGTKIEFKDKDGKALGAVLLGKKFMKEGGGGGGFGGPSEFPVGRYIMPVGGSRVSLVSETLDDIEAKPESWLNRDFFKVENVSSVALAGATDTQKWKISRESASADWKLEGAKPDEKIDGAKANPAATAFQNLTFTDVLAPDSKPEESGLDKPVVITIETFDGFTYVLKSGKEKDGNVPVTVQVGAKFATERAPGKDEKPEDKTRLDDQFKMKLKGFEEKLATEKKFESRAYWVPKSTVDEVVKDRAALFSENPPATPPGNGAGSPQPGVPSSLAVPPTQLPIRKPIEAVTPPVSVPPMPKPKEGQQPPTAAPAPAQAEPAKTPEATSPAVEKKPEPVPAESPKAPEAPKPAEPAAKP